MKKLIVISIFALAATVASLAQNWKLSPMVREAAMMEKAYSQRGETTSGSKAAGRNERRCITAFVRTSDESVLQREGCSVLMQSEDIYIATIPLDRIYALAAMPEVMRIEAGESCHTTTDRSAVLTRTDELWNLGQDYSTLAPFTGTGVVVGVMDVGFDLTHPNFYSQDGSRYRIKALWDQIDYTDGGEPVNYKGELGGWNVGRQYVGEEALLRKGHSSDGKEENHGTHTCGTAAGSGAPFLSGEGEVVYSGMAPDADICLVANSVNTNIHLVPEESRYKHNTATDMLGFRYIFDYAESVGKPCVINFSEGTHDDLYQSGLYGEVLSKLLGPGRILVASAGNEGIADGTYLHKAIGEDSKSTFLGKRNSNTAVYVMKSKEPVRLTLDMYKDSIKAVTWEYDTENLREYPDSVMFDTVMVGDHEMVMTLNAYPSCFNEDEWATDFFIIDKQSSSMGRDVPVKLTVCGRDNDIEVYSGGGYFVKSIVEPTLADFEHTHNVLFPGSSKDAVCVGATAHTQWRTNIYGNNTGTDYGTGGIRASFSGIGPTISSMTKPDVMAPGTNIVASYSSFNTTSTTNTSATTTNVKMTEWNGRSYPWGVNSGTSMATPQVTGIVALWLQACPTLTPDQVKDVIAHTAVRRDGNMCYPNNEYGWGEIDAKAGLDYILDVYTCINDLSIPAQHAIKSIYTIDGKRVDAQPQGHGIFIINDNGRIRKVVK